MSSNHFFFIKHTNRVLCTFVLLELPLHEAELSLGPLQVPLQSRDLRSTGGSGQQRRLLIHIDILC